MSLALPTLEIGGCEGVPIVLGGMSVQLAEAELTATIAIEGAFGTIGGVGLGLTEKSLGKKTTLEANEIALAKNIRDALEMSNDGNIGVNLMVATTGYEESVGVAVKNGAKYIASGAGLPLALPGYVMKYAHEYGISPEKTPALVPIVSSVRVAKIVINRWEGNFGKEWGDWYGKPLLPDAIIIETPNTAGGHLGAKPEDIGKPEYEQEYVIPEMLRYFKEINVNIPIIAAGGVWDRSDIDRMLLLGASGVQMSTRFIGTKECGGTQAFKDRHIFNIDPIVIIKSPVGLPGRAIENDFVRSTNAGEIIDLGPCVGCLTHCIHCKDRTAGYCIARALFNAHQGDTEKGILFTGTNGHRLIENRVVNYSAVKIMEELTTTPEVSPK